MKKLLQFSLLAGILLSQPVLHAAAETDSRKLNEYKLSEACKEFDLEEVKRLLDARIDPNTHSVLHHAINRDNPVSLELVELLIREGADVNRKGGFLGRTVFEETLEESLPFEQKKAKMLALINGGVQIDYDMMRRAKQRQLQYLERFRKGLIPSILEIIDGEDAAHVRHKGPQFEDIRRSIEELNQLEQTIKDAQERREKLCTVVAEFVPVKELAELACEYERGP